MSDVIHPLKSTEVVEGRFLGKRQNSRTPRYQNDIGHRTSDIGHWNWSLAFFSTLLLIALPLVALFLAHRLWIRRKGMVGLREKLTGRGPRLTPGQIMVHGVSLGEVNLMRPVVPKLEAAFGARCLLTTTTETGRARLDEVFADHERAFLPLDFPWAVLTFLRRAKPRMVVLLELEVWPVLLLVCHLRGIPVVLLNARVSERSFRGYMRGRWLLRPLFRNIALALGQNGMWSARLVGLGVRRERVMVSGSMKADMVGRASDEAMQREGERLGLRAEQPVLLLASTSAGNQNEEQFILAPQFSQWMERGWQVVICPRHPERGTEIATLVATLPNSPQIRRSSQRQRLDGPAQVMVVDEIGKLAALYAWTASVNGIAIVGGSFGSGRGGQNMLEATAAGCCTVVGWDTRNFPDAMALLTLADGVVAVTRDDCHQVLAALYDDPDRRFRLGENGQRAWENGRGAVERSIDLVKRQLSG
jgi:3-deoxy-D-manno-octulosonic-acid transferase